MTPRPQRSTLFPYTTLFRSLRPCRHGNAVCGDHPRPDDVGLHDLRNHAGLSDPGAADGDRKSTRLNSSHRCISYAVFCLKKKNTLYYVSELVINVVELRSYT